MTERNYWVVSPNVKDNEEEADWKEFLSKNLNRPGIVGDLNI